MFVLTVGEFTTGKDMKRDLKGLFHRLEINPGSREIYTCPASSFEDVEDIFIRRIKDDIIGQDCWLALFQLILVRNLVSLVADSNTNKLEELIDEGMAKLANPEFFEDPIKR